LGSKPWTTFLILRAMRPRQWMKNLLLFAGLFFSRNLLDPLSVKRALAGFVIFCGLSGAVYLLNDLIDAPRDRLHPRKRHRPIAAGQLAPRDAVLAIILLLAAGLGAALWLSSYFWICCVAYLVLMLSYTTILKEIFLIDTLIIALGFIIRAVSGVIVLRTPDNQVDLTSWFVICVLFLSLLLAFCKRRSELVNLEGSAIEFRPVLSLYSLRMMDSVIAVCAAGCILSYTLYATHMEELWLMLSTLPFVLYGIFRYLYLVYNSDVTEAPEHALASDPPLLGCVFLWGCSLVLVYFPA